MKMIRFTMSEKQLPVDGVGGLQAFLPYVMKREYDMLISADIFILSRVRCEIPVQR